MSFDNELISNWKEFSNRINGNFFFDQTKYIIGDKFKCKIQYKFEDLTINFITKQSRTATISANNIRQNTIVFAEINDNSNFKFVLFPEKLTDKVLKVIGVQDILIGIPELDKKYIFKGNDESRLKKIFGNTLISNILVNGFDLNFNLEIKKGKSIKNLKLPNESTFLIFETDNLIRSEYQLEMLLDLFKTTLIELKK